jgi:hypothetical protein
MRNVRSWPAGSGRPKADMSIVYEGLVGSEGSRKLWRRGLCWNLLDRGLPRHCPSAHGSVGATKG